MKTPSRGRLMSYCAIGLALAGFAAFEWVEFANAENPMETARAATVQISVIASPPDFKKPWQTSDTEQRTGSGAIIAGNRILTNAHVVANAVSIEVKRNGQVDKYPAEVQHYGHDCDLAVLTVEDPSFFTGVDPLELGDLPGIQSEVHAYGYPIGGESVSITSGVVSRIEFSMYAHSYRTLMCAHIDAAINPGNSGGPVVTEGRLVGVAMQTLQNGENVGYMIPSPVVGHFLEDIEDGRVDGVPLIGVDVQALESESLRASLGLAKGESGLMILQVNHGSSAWGSLDKGDVLLEVDGEAIANDGTVDAFDDQRLDFTYRVQLKQVGEPLELTVLRDGERLTKSITLTAQDYLVPLPAHSSRAEYRIFGGLVFQPLDLDYLLALENQKVEFSSYIYMNALEDNMATPKRQELVALASVLPHKVNRGYQDWANDVVMKVQGVDVVDFAHFNQLLDEAEGQWLEVELNDLTVVVLDLEEARKATKEVMEKFNIARERWEESPIGKPVS